jgi:general secretion pathway protein A
VSCFPLIRGGVLLRLRSLQRGRTPSDNFFAFRENPFTLTPNPRFLHRTRHAHETLGRLMRGILDRKGLILLSGEIGTGKTTLLYSALHLMSVSPAVQNKIGTALIVHPTLTPDEFLEAVLDEFGVPCPSTRKDRRLEALLKMLLEVRRKGGVAVLVIDEAQMLSTDVLEEIRELLSLQTSQHKLLQIVLCGQPEIEDKLRGMSLRSGEPFVAARCNTAPLSLKDTHEYVQHRLRIAGACSDALFTPESVDAIHMHADGIPRLINLLCAQALSVASFYQAARVFPYMIDEAAAEICSGAPIAPPSGMTLRTRPIPSRRGPTLVNSVQANAIPTNLDDPRSGNRPAAASVAAPSAAISGAMHGNPAQAIRLKSTDTAKGNYASASQSNRRKGRDLRHRAKFAEAAAKRAQARTRQITIVEFTQNTAHPPAEFRPSGFRASPFLRGRPRLAKRRALRQCPVPGVIASLVAWNQWLNRWCSEHFTSKSCGKPLFQLGLLGTVFLALSQASAAGFPQRHAARVTFGFLGLILIDISLGLGTYLLLVERHLTPGTRAHWAQALFHSLWTLRRLCSASVRLFF